MPILNRASEMQQDAAGWRRLLHEQPEIGFDLPRTTAFVAEKLRAFGCDEVVTGVDRTGIVALIRGRMAVITEKPMTPYGSCSSIHT